MGYEAETTALLQSNEEEKKEATANAPKAPSDVDYTRTAIRVH